MKRQTAARHIRLDADEGRTVRLLSSLPVRSGQKLPSVVTITRTGTFTDPRYGTFEISKELLEQMVSNFKRDAYGQAIYIDRAHKPEDGAMAVVKELSVERNRLRAKVEWTPAGERAVREEGFNYLSAEFHENYVDNETQEQYGPVLMGAGLVIRPAIKRLDPILALAEADDDDDHPLLIHPSLCRQLSQEAKIVMDKFLKQLKAHLEKLGLNAEVVKQLCEAFQASAKNLGDDEDSLKALCESFEQTGKSLHEQVGDKAVKLSINLPEPGKKPAAKGEGEDPPAKTLSEADVVALMEKREKDRAAEAKKLEEDLGAKKKRFRKVLEEAKGLSEETRKEAMEAEELITAGMTDEQVDKLAEHQLSQANKIEASRQLAGMGYQVGGTPRISLEENNAVKSLQETICQNLRGSSQHTQGALRLQEEDKLHPFVAKVLAEFDRHNARRLHQEHKALAGETTISDSDLPVSYNRTVIREALSDLRVLDLVNTMTDFNATATTQIPYEERDVSAIGNYGIVSEGQGIPFAGMSQKMALAYIQAVKLALKVSNEVMHFSRASSIDWDAWARSAASNARFLKELIVRRICNEMQRAADSYLAADVNGEDIAAQLDGATSTIKTANFPIVRPFQQKDLQGNNVGNAENPISIDLNGTPATEYDGTGTQAAGTYFRVTNYNLGYVQLVDETGTPATPNLAVASIDYSYATNIVKFDTDNGATELPKHLNGLLRAIGERKATLDQDRYVEPNFLLMSATLNDTCTNAEQFTPLTRRDGTDTTAMGDLEMVKSVPAWKTNAPSVDLGEERILIGQRGAMSYSIAKPFMTGTPFEAVDANGKPTGQKVAYGEEYSAVKVPDPLKARFTSVIAYSDSNR